MLTNKVKLFCRSIINCPLYTIDLVVIFSVYHFNSNYTSQLSFIELNLPLNDQLVMEQNTYSFK